MGVKLFTNCTAIHAILSFITPLFHAPTTVSTTIISLNLNEA